MVEKSTTQTRLCPNCANSVQEHAESCPYCKADIPLDSAPQWLNRDDPSSESRVASSQTERSSLASKLIWPAAMILVAFIGFFAGAYMQHSEPSLPTQVDLMQLQAKDQMIQSQEAQLAQTRKELSESSTQLAEMKAKLEESQKELSATQQRLGAATREVNRLSTSRSVAATRSSQREPYATAPLPAPATTSRAAEPGVYETTQATSVYEGPSSSSRVITQIGRGTRINVVSSAGNWLEVRSKRGNPPGYIRSDDARQIARTN